MDSIFLSPQQIELFNRRERICSDIEFSLGIVMLYCCTLKNPNQTIYSVDSYNRIQIEYHEIDKQLEEVKDKYQHQFLGKILEKLLQKDKSERGTIQMINRMLIQYRSKISNFENFTANLESNQNFSYDIQYNKQNNVKKEYQKPQQVYYEAPKMTGTNNYLNQQFYST